MATYYVDADSGSNSNNGLTEGTALLTLDYALGLIATSGDIIKLKANTTAEYTLSDAYAQSQFLYRYTMTTWDEVFGNYAVVNLINVSATDMYRASGASNYYKFLHLKEIPHWNITNVVMWCCKVFGRSSNPATSYFWANSTNFYYKCLFEDFKQNVAGGSMSLSAYAPANYFGASYCTFRNCDITSYSSNTKLYRCIVKSNVSVPVGNGTVNTDYIISDALNDGYWGVSDKAKLSLSDCVIGDSLTCDYIGSSNSAGTFSSLGSGYLQGIPRLSTDIPSGSFNWVCVDRKDGFGGVFIADRNIQHSISWNNIRAGGYVDGSLIADKKHPIMTDYVTGDYICFDTSHYTSNYGWQVFNSKFDTIFWTVQVSNLPARVGMIYPTPQVFDKIRAFPRIGYLTRFPSSFKIQGSNDTTNGSDGTWDDLLTVSGFTCTESVWQYWKFINTTAYKAYGFLFESCADASYGNIQELEFCKDFGIIQLPTGGNQYHRGFKDLTPTMSSNGPTNGVTLDRSSVYVGGQTFEIWYAFDDTFNKTNAGWFTVAGSNPIDQWFSVTFDTAKKVDAIAIQVDGQVFSSGTGTCPTKVEVFYGPDSNTLTSLGLYDMATTTDRQLLHVDIASCNYIRVNIREIENPAVTSNWTAISQIEILEYVYESGIGDTDSNYGAYPITNDWDKYILRNNLDGNIVPASNDVWNWQDLYSFCREYPNRFIVNSLNRVVRGNTSASAFGTLDFSTANATHGFRPKLLMFEGDNDGGYWR